jgi:hypothetical protein
MTVDAAATSLPSRIRAALRAAALIVLAVAWPATSRAESREVIILGISDGDPRAWPDATQRLAAELSQARHAVTIVLPSDPSAPTGEALRGAVAGRHAVAGLVLYRVNGQPHGCLDLLDVPVQCKALFTTGAADSALFAVEWLHEHLVTRGLWVDESWRDDYFPPGPIPSDVSWSLALTGGAFATLDARALGVASLRAMRETPAFFDFAIELSGTAIPTTVDDPRGSATVGFGALGVRASADVIASPRIRCGPTASLGVLVGVGRGTGAPSFMGHADASVSAHGDAGIHAALALSRSWWLVADVALAWTFPTVEVRFADERVASLGGAAALAQLGVALDL